MKLLKILLLVIIAVSGLQSCYYDVEEELYPQTGGCDTSNATLSGKVKPILQGQCYSCHSTASSASSGGNINLETYSGLRVQVDNGKLLKSIRHESGASAMPKGRLTTIDLCDIKIIEKWVINGALDN